MDIIPLLSSELLESSNLYVTKETIVLRVMKRLANETFNTSWFDLMDTIRQGTCLLDERLHSLLQTFHRRHPDEFVERVLSKDYVKPVDILKLAGILSKHLPDAGVYELFAVDGLTATPSSGLDLKKYVDHLKWTLEEYKWRHVKGVREMYRCGLSDPEQVSRVLRNTFQAIVDDERGENMTTGDASVTCNPNRSTDGMDARAVYLECIDGKHHLMDIIQWKMHKERDGGGTSGTSGRKTSGAAKRKRGGSEKEMKPLQGKCETPVTVVVTEESSVSEDVK